MAYITVKKKTNQRVDDGNFLVFWTLHFNTLKIDKNQNKRKNPTHSLTEHVIFSRIVSPKTNVSREKGPMAKSIFPFLTFQFNFLKIDNSRNGKRSELHPLIEQTILFQRFTTLFGKPSANFRIKCLKYGGNLSLVSKSFQRNMSHCYYFPLPSGFVNCASDFP